MLTMICNLVVKKMKEDYISQVIEKYLKIIPIRIQTKPWVTQEFKIC